MTGSATSKPEPLYRSGFAIIVPNEVHPSGAGIIVGREWAPDNRKNSQKNLGSGWCYYVRLEEGKPAQLVTEEQVTKWQK